MKWCSHTHFQRRVSVQKLWYSLTHFSQMSIKTDTPEMKKGIWNAIHDFLWRDCWFISIHFLEIYKWTAQNIRWMCFWHYYMSYLKIFLIRKSHTWKYSVEFIKSVITTAHLPLLHYNFLVQHSFRIENMSNKYHQRFKTAFVGFMIKSSLFQGSSGVFCEVLWSLYKNNFIIKSSHDLGFGNSNATNLLNII